MSEYRQRIAAALADGWSFAGLHASAGGEVVRVALTAADGSTRIETVSAEGGSVPSIVDLAPAAGWDEREAGDIYGVGFEGHEPLRPLVAHDLDLRHWTVPVRGVDPYQVAVGPIHAGVIESGHFRFHVVGDKILHVDARLFYKRRGLERAAEGQELGAGLAYATRACAACAVSNGVAYALAAERALGLESSAELARARTILLELERVWNHMNDIAAVCAGVGLAAGANRFLSLTEAARRLNERVAGHRFGFGAVAVGLSLLELDRRAVATARAELSEIQAAARRAWRELTFNASFNDRLPDVGIVSEEDALALGAVGPAARASGIRRDAREVSGGLAYESFAAVVPERAAGDVQARLEQRALELWQSLALLETLLADPVAPSRAEQASESRAIGVARVESPRGATLCVVEQSETRIERLRLRTGSYANWPVLAACAAGNLLPDFPLINKSFELCYACVDR